MQATTIPTSPACRDMWSMALCLITTDRYGSSYEFSVAINHQPTGRRIDPHIGLGKRPYKLSIQVTEMAEGKRDRCELHGFLPAGGYINRQHEEILRKRSGVSS